MVTIPEAVDRTMHKYAVQGVNISRVMIGKAAFD